MSKNDNSDDDDVPTLSAETMGALMEFYKEQEERNEKLRQIEEGQVPETFDEDWVSKTEGLILECLDCYENTNHFII